MQTPKSILKTLEAGEHPIWIGKAHHLELRLKAVAFTFCLIFSGFTVFFFKEIAIPFWQGETPLYEGKPVTSLQIWLLGLILSFLWLFLFIAHYMQSKIRYVVTNQRAFIYNPTLSLSVYYDFKSKSWKRDYTNEGDDSVAGGPISEGGYFTPSTSVEQISTGKYGSILINNLEKNKNITQEAADLKSRFPILKGFPVVNRPRNLTFRLVENPDTIKVKIQSILDKYQSTLDQTSVRG